MLETHVTGSIDYFERPQLAQIYRHWLDRRGSREFPRCADLDPAVFSAVSGYLSMIDVIYGPLRSRVRLMATAAAARRGWDMTGLMADEIPEPQFRERTLIAFREVVERRWPVLEIRRARPSAAPL